MTDYPDDLSDLPASTQLVYWVLKHEGEMTRSEVREVTDISESALDDAIKHLEIREHLSKSRNSDDLRQVSIKIREGPRI